MRRIERWYTTAATRATATVQARESAAESTNSHHVTAPSPTSVVIANGAVEVGGRLPINTHGGQLGEAYIHGMNGIAEGVRQLRGTSVNPVPDVEHVLVTAGTGVPTSGLILG